GSPDGVDIRLGTWSARSDTRPQTQDRRLAVVASVLRGLYPVVDVEPAIDQPCTWPLGGMALGVPAPIGVDDADGSVPIDRVIRSMTGTSWAALVLAYPVAENAIANERSGLLN